MWQLDFAGVGAEHLGVFINAADSVRHENALAAVQLAVQRSQRTADCAGILQVVDGQEVWTEVTVKSKAYKPTKVSPAFDPYEVAAEWEAEKKAKAGVKAAKEAEKAAKVAAAKAKKENEA